MLSMVFFMASGVFLISFSSNFPNSYYTFSKISLGLLSVGILGFYLIQRYRLISFVGKWISKRSLGRRLGEFIHHIQEFDERLVQFYTQKRPLFFGAMGLNLLNWYLGAFEIFIILYLKCLKKYLLNIFIKPAKHINLMLFSIK